MIELFTRRVLRAALSSTSDARSARRSTQLNQLLGARPLIVSFGRLRVRWRRGKQMTAHFSLWLEFEAGQPWNSDPADDVFNMIIRLRDGREYALNVWTFKYFERARAEARDSGDALAGSYVVAPDLFVERLDRTHIETVVADLLGKEALSNDWLVPPNDNEHAFL